VICIYQPCVVEKTLQGCSRRTWARGEFSRFVDGFSKKKSVMKKKNDKAIL